MHKGEAERLTYPHPAFPTTLPPLLLKILPTFSITSAKPGLPDPLSGANQVMDEQTIEYSIPDPRNSRRANQRRVSPGGALSPRDASPQPAPPSQQSETEGLPKSQKHTTAPSSLSSPSPQPPFARPRQSMALWGLAAIVPFSISFVHVKGFAGLFESRLR